MKKYILAVSIFYLSMVAAYAEQTAEQVIKQVFDNAVRIQNVEAVAISEIISEKDGITKIISKDAKKVSITKPYSKTVKKLDLVTKAELPGQEDIPTGDLPITNEKKYLYPKCLYGIDDYLADFNLSLVPKDERIKQGKEEIIAIKNGQDTEYPQIRVVVKGDAVESMKFFAMNGVKYYEIIVDKTAKISTISIPVELTEKFYTEAGTMTNTLKYEGINLK